MNQLADVTWANEQGDKYLKNTGVPLTVQRSGVKYGLPGLQETDPDTRQQPGLSETRNNK